MTLPPPPIRPAAKAVIIRDDQLLVVANHDADGTWYILPGGGQNYGETLPETLQRECEEEIGTQVEIGRLLWIREYIGPHHEFAQTDHAHQIEFMFACQVPKDYEPRLGTLPDGNQHGVAWLPLTELDRQRLYPARLKKLLVTAWDQDQVYLGDIN